MLPVHHIFLALKAMVPIVMMTVILQSDGKYHLLSTDPIEMQSHPDRREEVVQNAEVILRIAEDFIRLAPLQWSMTLPVWPDILNQVPE
jgi:lauroyl/myristoyl acyltransferase